MNISDLKFNRQINTNTNQATARPVSNDNSSESANAMITKLSKGDVFKGQILDVKNNQVVISLDGKNLLAHMAEAMNLNIGDELSFMVKENLGNSVAIKPLADSIQNMKDNTLFKILDANNFSPTEKNYNIAESLMKNNMPVDKGSMQKIMQQSIKYPEAKIDTLVSLNKLGIEVNEASINQYEDFVSNNLKVMNSVSELADDFGQLSSNLIDGANGDIGQILDISGELLNIISDEEDMSNIILDESQAELNISEELGEQVNNLQENEDNIAKTLPEQNQINGESSLDGEVQNITIVEDISDKIEGFAKTLKLDGEVVNQLVSDLSNAGISEDLVNALIDNSKSPAQLLNNINSIINNQLDSLNQDLIAALFGSDAYKSVLTESLKHKLSLDGDNMKDPEELNELYKNIYDKTDKLINAFSENKSDLSGNMSDTAHNLRDQLDFVQNLNNMYAYAQIPVNISGNETNSELFVYMNKKNMKEAKDKVTALLHLDMDHLGATDVHVSLSNNIVSTKFYVEDEESARIIDENMKILEKAINDCGYSLVNEVVARDVKTTSKNMIVDEIVGKDLEQSVKRYSFDIRM